MAFIPSLRGSAPVAGELPGPATFPPWDEGSHGQRGDWPPPAPDPVISCLQNRNNFCLLWAPYSIELPILELYQIDSCQSPLFLQPFHFIFRPLSPFFPFCPWFSRQPIWAEPYSVTSCQNNSGLSSVV